MSYKADEYEEIARRLKELEADKHLALTGTTAEPKATESPDYYGLNATYGDYAC